MKITVLTGGVGGARFLQGVQQLVDIPAGWRADGAGLPDADHAVTAIVNVGDDAWAHGVRICPDLDACMYTLGGVIAADRGRGRADDTYHCADELRAHGARPEWIRLGDRDLATHLLRTEMLDAGYRLTDVTAALCTRWSPGATLLPATDDRCETHAVAEIDGERCGIHLREWWNHHHASVPTHSFVQVGAETSTPAPGVLTAIEQADVVLVAPSNPVVSIDAVLAVPGIRAALRTTAAPVVGISPVIAGAPIRGRTDLCLAAVGVECTAAAIAAHLGARSATGILDGWLLAEEDAPTLTTLPAGIVGAAVPLRMTDPVTTATLVRAALELVGLRP